ncbi:MAG: GTPase domain-containing protein [Gemmatimonadetes bacterium]|nr:GTPase domain-containing protein [Gemmatimonadota bacterium]
MARLDQDARTLSLTLVVYGAARAGKSALLRAIHERIAVAHRGDEEPLGEPSDVGLPLNWVPLDLGDVAGWRTRVHLYAVPAQEQADATRRLVLAQADGVLFVVDAQASRLEANVAALAALHAQWPEGNGTTRVLPVVFVVTKQDLPEELLLEEPVLAAILNPEHAPLFRCDLARGEGVFRALQSLIGTVMRQVVALPETAT